MKLKEKIRNNELSWGSWITLGHPDIAEIMANAGFDWLTVDMEHSATSLEQAQRLIQVIGLCGCVPLVRVPENHPTIIKQVMDAGAQGVIVPMVNTKEDAEKAVRSVQYSPSGKRGVGLARAQGYGLEFERYRDWLPDGAIVIAQIEDIQAVQNLESILSVPGIDATLIGPFDLSASLGLPGQFEAPTVREALDRYVAVNRKLGKTMGFHVIPSEVEKVGEKIDQGYRLIAWSLDTLFLGTVCKQGMGELKKKYSKSAP